jgi:hypothetical protein
MVIAIRHKDQTGAIESGKAALAELNATRLPAVSGGSAEGTTAGKEDRLLVRERAMAATTGM